MPRKLDGSECAGGSLISLLLLPCLLLLESRQRCRYRRGGRGRQCGCVGAGGDVVPRGRVIDGDEEAVGMAGSHDDYIGGVGFCIGGFNDDYCELVVGDVEEEHLFHSGFGVGDQDSASSKGLPFVRATELGTSMEAKGKKLSDFAKGFAGLVSS
ncbi:hypothetical protein Syun_018336 [Stephania yunnanensis]|uniref:Uncharacterized protein n=1 Tax=Stephania yunnanensis TaxID=152371 RepID=A0AAP0IS43_9MAGN